MFSTVGRRVPVVSTDKVRKGFGLDLSSFLPPAVATMFSAVGKGLPAVSRHILNFWLAIGLEEVGLT